MADCSVETRDLVKRHGSTAAVDHVSLQIKRGEFFSILGPSGAGKTSVLRLLAGFERPDEGEILIEDRPMTGVPPNRRPVNLVFQSYALFPHLTVFQNIAFGLEMRRLPREEIESRVQAALEMVRLGKQRARYPSQLSGGEQQRVALARALVNRPAVVLLDEPLAALDQQLRQEMQVELKAIQEQVGVTMVCVTHHQEEALTMSDRVAVMDRGRVLQVGRPHEIYDAPVSLFVARFIGLSNELTGSVVTLENGMCGVDPSGLHPSRPIRVRCLYNVAVGDRVTVVLRPERVRLSTETRPSGDENVLEARVEKAIYSGHELHYLLRLSDHVLWKARIANGAGDRKRFAAGERVFIRWSADDGVVLRA